MTAADVLQEYEDRIRELEAAGTRARLRGQAAGIWLALAIALLLTLGVYAIARARFFWWPAMAVPFLVVSGRRYRRARRTRYDANRLTRSYLRGVARLRGEWAGGGEDGEEFTDLAHPYAADLNVFGEGSLFELLCTARSAMGKRGLPEYLLATPDVAEIRARQQAIQELKGHTALREKLAVLGDFEFMESKGETFTEWLDSPPFIFSRALQKAPPVTSSLVLIVLLGG